MTIGKKTYLGFGVILFLLLIVGSIALRGINTISGEAGLVIDGNALDAELAQREVDHLVWAGKVSDLLNDKDINTLDVQTDPHKCGFGVFFYGEKRAKAEELVPALKPLFAEIEPFHTKLHQTALEIKAAYHPADSELPARLLKIKLAHMNWAKRIREALLLEEDSLEGVQTDPALCAYGRWLESDHYAAVYKIASEEFKQILEDISKHHNELHTSAKFIDQQLGIDVATAREEAKTYFFEITLPLFDATIESFDELYGLSEDNLADYNDAQYIFSEETVPALSSVQRLLHEIRKTAKSNIINDTVLLNTTQQTERNVMIIMLAGMALGLLLAFFLARGIIVPLKKISLNLQASAADVSESSDELFSGSESLAAGASEQAASLQETVASIEELSAMVRSNADQSAEAELLMKKAAPVLDQASMAMQMLITQMAEISSSSHETQKIVKTIDEIAFQTNLLALNAAVEAARAGESGAGFAVVADEVRNLALRAAEAAKNTSSLIENTVGKIDKGSVLAGESNTSLQEATGSVKKVGRIVEDVSRASQEQSEGVLQIRNAVTRIDVITQQNAGSAEESSGSAGILNGLANSLTDNISQLMSMVDGQKKSTSTQIPQNVDSNNQQESDQRLLDEAQ